MHSQGPTGPPSDVAPPGSQEAPPGRPSAAAQQNGHAGPWILAAAVILVLGVLAAVLIHNADTSDTQTVITRSPTINTTTVQRTGPTVTQATTTVNPSSTITAPTATATVTQPTKTVTVTKPKTSPEPEATTP